MFYIYKHNQHPEYRLIVPKQAELPTEIREEHYTSDLFGQFDFRNVELIWSDFYYQDGLKTLGPVLEPFGFVVLLHDKAFLIFRGTRGDVRPDVQADKDIQKTPYASGGNVSRGFWRVFDGLQGSLRGQLQKVKDSGHDLVISGHSLGSTLATFAVPLAADPANGFGLPVTAYPQASPKVGDPDAAYPVDSGRSRCSVS